MEERGEEAVKEDEADSDADSVLSVGKEDINDKYELKISQKLTFKDSTKSVEVRDHHQGDDSEVAPEEPDFPEGYEMFETEAPPEPELPTILNVQPPDQASIDNLIDMGAHFKDKNFPHHDGSIFDPERGANPKLEDLEWKRARDILGKDFCILPEKDSDIAPINIKQGDLGDCYLLSALSALAEWPKRVRQIFVNPEPNESGLYILRLYLNGSMTEVVVDDYFPCRGNKLAFCYNSDGKSIWPMLIEKAYAKVFGSYQRIESGTMMESLQLLTCAYIDILDHAETPLNELWGEIRRADMEDYIILTNVHTGDALTSERLKALGLVDNHAYTLIGAHEVKDREGKFVRLLKIRNPWGHGEWEGDWSDNSTKWTEELKERLEF